MSLLTTRCHTALSNAERQRLYIRRLKAKAAEPAPGAGNGKGMAVAIDERWRTPLADAERIIGVPPHEFVEIIMQLGNQAFNRKFQNGLTNEIAWWLIEMHSKYPDSFNVSAWEGSCNELAIDKLYAERGVPVGKYQEWQAEHDAKENEITKRKAAWRQKMEASGMRAKMEIDRELKRERALLEAMKNGTCLVLGRSLKKAIAEKRKDVRELEQAAQKAGEAVAARQRPQRRARAKSGKK